MKDEIYKIPEEIQSKVKNKFFDQNGSLILLPAKYNKKMIVLRIIVNNFENDRIYTEKDVNDILKRIYPDFVTIRRMLIDFGLLQRTRDCSSYWLTYGKENNL